MSLKILHVGNVAQNGYVNAKILRARGHDCDLVAPDLYHAGSSPEWFEMSGAEVDPRRLGDDPFFPDLYALGRDRPDVGDWVAQGPYLPALTYLSLKRRSDPRAHLALSVLCYFRFKSTMQRSTETLAMPMEREAFELCLARYDLEPRLNRRIRLGRMAEDCWTRILSRVLLQEDTAYVRGWRPPVALGTLDPYFAADPELGEFVEALRARGLAEALSVELPGPPTDRAAAAPRGFTAEEATPFLWGGHVLHDLAALYDISIFYGDSSKFVFAAGVENYWALEHGTIRTVPFEPGVNGRMVAAGFLNAERVFLTNTDYATASPRLEFRPDQRVYFPHPFDEAPAVAFRRDRPPRRDPARVVFFCPARQDWRVPDPRMGKANDLYFLAGRLLLDRGRSDFLLHCVDWGVDREASRALVAELGLEDLVRWSPIKPKEQVWAAMVDAHAVVDQFLLSAFGSVSIDAMALGCRLISRDDGVNNAVFFAEAPPVLAAATAEQVAARMLAVMDDPEDAAGLGERGVDWIRRYHSADRIHALQMAALAGRGGAEQRVT